MRVQVPRHRRRRVTKPLRGHIDAHAREAKEIQGKSPATVARWLSALASFYGYLVAEEAIAGSPPGVALQLVTLIRGLNRAGSSDTWSGPSTVPMAVRSRSRMLAMGAQRAARRNVPRG